MHKHPWLPYDYAKRIDKDLKRKNTSNPEALRALNREYQSLRRAEKRGEKDALPDNAIVVLVKYLRRKRKKE